MFRLFQLWPRGTFSLWLLSPFDTTPDFFDCFLAFYYYTISRLVFYIFCFNLKSAIFPRKWYLEAMIWRLAVLISIGFIIVFTTLQWRDLGNTFFILKRKDGASLVAQWLRICLPMRGTWVRALVWEDPTCRGATRPVSHNYWACVSGACAPQTSEAAIVRGPRIAMKSGPCLPQLEKALAQKRRPNTAKHK